LMVASGFLVYINGFKSILFKRDEFKRTEDDLLSVSNNLMAIGRYEDALEWLGRIERPGPRALLAFIMAYVALGRFDRARAAAMAWADARAILEDTREAVAEKLLVDSLASVASSLNGPDLAKATAHLAPTADPIHLSAVTESILLRKALTNEEALASLPDGNPRAALARAVAFMLTGDLGEAVESVEKFVPANRAEEMVGKSVVVRCAFFLCVAQPDSTNGETLKERIEEFAADLDTGAIVPRDDFERLDLANVVLVMADLGRWCKATSAEALETLGGTLLEDMRPEVEFATARRFSKATRTVRLKFLKRLTFPEASKRVA